MGLDKESIDAWPSNGNKMYILVSGYGTTGMRDKVKIRLHPTITQKKIYFRFCL